MKTCFETLAVAFGMFSALPVPQPEWNEKNMKYALCAFPLVGVLLGGLWLLWAKVCALLALPDLLRGAGFCLLPVAVTGGIHLDGYADVSDALASWATPERRQEILKDSHCGAFAIIRLCTYFVGYFALCATLLPQRDALLCMAVSFLLSRTLSGLAIATLPLARNSGLAHTFVSAAHRGRVQVVLSLAALVESAVLLWLGGLSALAILGAALLCLWHYSRTAKKHFGGVSGDLAGWFLQKAEFWMLCALVLSQYVEGSL